ncbi:hypothetical protein AVEN_205216-1 [Araneus ventricosus]|uniref:Uncharacterized protein n=1 Tax=Araneus ventricosus TaxID=182803 RepID=A0A4Y2JUM1_ARAVE|nr:hypothetical protein AVEN_205216-1 [Araneus ventricosus]
MNWTLPNPGVHLPHHPTPAIIFPQGARKWAVVGKDNCTSYRASLLSDLRNSPLLKRSRPAFVVAKGKVLDRLARYERVKSESWAKRPPAGVVASNELEPQ